MAVGLMVLAPGATMPALDVAPGVKGVLGGELTAKYGFVCTGHDWFANVSSRFAGTDISKLPRSYRLCNQGMNEAGLALSLQANRDNATISEPHAFPPASTTRKTPGPPSTSGSETLTRALPPPSVPLHPSSRMGRRVALFPGRALWMLSSPPDDRAPALSLPPPPKHTPHAQSLSNAILASYATVAEVKAAYSKYQIVYNPQYYIFGASVDDPPVWLAIYDATGAGIVIQFKMGYGEVVDNPVGVVSNDPGLMEDHLELYLAQVKKLRLTVDPATKLLNGPITTLIPGVTALGTLQTFKDPFSIPGGYDGDARFMRMALLKGVASLQKCGPDPEISTTSYAALEPGYPASLPSLMVVDQILRTVTIPQGMTDFGSAVVRGDPARYDTSGYEVEAVYTYNLRDLTNKVLYYRTANNFVWRKFDFGKADWRRFGGTLYWERLRGVPDNFGFVDVTATVGPGGAAPAAGAAPGGGGRPCAFRNTWLGGVLC
ncbi:MAG: hypothetical protein J3K34DRAFT_400638 [Monoraphidium minutum]|nr:MAG: hypothetical protein J3K34DRAFT_400638 [Monoraphidium minutum]